MGLFQTRKPRKFRRVSIYTDEQKDRLDQLVRETRQEMGEIPVEEQDFTNNRFKGKFGQYTPRTQNRNSRSRRLSWPIAIVILAALMMLWRFLARY